MTVFVTSRAGVITGSKLENARTLLCTPNTGPVNISSSLTAGYVIGIATNSNAIYDERGVSCFIF